MYRQNQRHLRGPGQMAMNGSFGRLRRLLRLTAAFMFLQLSAWAGFADDCGGAGSQYDLDVCAGQQYSAADKALNATYAALMHKISHAGQASLQAAQRAWLDYRDKQCTFNLLGRSDGSAYPMVLANCKTRLTEQQTEQLKAQLTCEEGDLSCGGQ